MGEVILISCIIFLFNVSMLRYSFKIVCCFCIYYSCRILRTSANILVINLAISDFFMLAKTPIYIYNSIKCGPALGDFGKTFLNVRFFFQKKKNIEKIYGMMTDGCIIGKVLYCDS